MKSKAPLVLMEQLIMLLVFALAAALCLQAFVLADARSRRAEARDRAAVLVQSAAETIRHSGGLSEAAAPLGAAYEEGALQLFYDENWNPVPSGGTYRVRAEELLTDLPQLGAARVAAETQEGEPELLFSIDIAWQEVPSHA